MASCPPVTSTARSVSGTGIQEYFVHYPIKADQVLESLLRQEIHPAPIQDVLDIGCGEGFLAAEMRRDGNRITGVDSSGVSETSALQVILADLDQGIAPVVAPARREAVHRFLLLECARAPEVAGAVLRECRGVLNRAGQLGVSLPNVANITVRLMLLWAVSITRAGILDRHSPAFLYSQDRRRLLENSGYRIVEETPTVMPVELVLGLSPQNIFMRALNRTLAFFTRRMPDCWLSNRLCGQDKALMRRSGDP